MIEVKCQACGARLNARDEKAGGVVKCGRCGATVNVPAPVFDLVDVDAPPPLAPPTASKPVISPAKPEQIPPKAIVDTTQAVRRERLFHRVATAAALLASGFAVFRGPRAELTPTAPSATPAPLVADVSPEVINPQVIKTQAITAQSFIIVDENGKPRGSLGCPPGMLPALTLMDEQGRKRLSMMLTADGHPIVALCGESGTAKLLLVASKSGAGVAIFDGQGKPMTALRDDEGQPSLFFSREGHPERLTLGLDGPSAYIKAITPGNDEVEFISRHTLTAGEGPAPAPR